MTKRMVVSAVLVAIHVSLPPCLLAGDFAGYPCYSVRESKRRGCFVCPVSFTPNTINWQGKQIELGEAWLERRTERYGPFALFLPLYKTVPGYNLCFTLTRGWEALDAAPRQPFFVLENKRSSFARIGTVVLYECLENLDRSEYTVLCVDNWKLDNPVTLTGIPALRSQHHGPKSPIDDPPAPPPGP
jgi:hypothetical protein